MHARGTIPNVIGTLVYLNRYLEGMLRNTRVDMLIASSMSYNNYCDILHRNALVFREMPVR